MRKLLVFLGIGLIALSGLLFFAERNQRIVESKEATEAIEAVLRGQNQALAGRIFAGLERADQDALLALQRWKKKAKARSFLSDTAFTEPDAPKWIIVAGRRVRAAGVSDDALLEDALDAHQNSADRLALYHSREKYYLFINGKVDGQDYAAAYSPEAFFSAVRSPDGIKSWLALQDGTVIYHPLHRFIGSNASNLKPVAAGIRELASGGAAPFSRSYLGLEGKDALGAWTPLPSYNLLVGSEWPQAPDSFSRWSAFFWFALATGTLGTLLVGLCLRSDEPRAAEPRLFDEGRLDEDAMEYLEEVRKSAAQAINVAEQRERDLGDSRQEREQLLSAKGEAEWKLSVLEEFHETLIRQRTGKQVWGEVCELMARRSPELSMIFYRYSPSSYSLVPESFFGSLDLPETALNHLRDTRIFLGKPSYLDDLLRTESFLKWNQKRQALMPAHRTEFRAYPIHGAGFTGAILVYFDQRMNYAGEAEGALALLDSLLRYTATFCDSQAHLLQSTDGKRSSGQAMASASDDARNRPRPS